MRAERARVASLARKTTHYVRSIIRQKAVMDLIYIPEVLTYGSFRSPQYRDYEQPWNKNYFDDGKTASYQQRQLQQHQQQNRDSKDSCHLCKENKRRSLAAYIRGKTRKNSCNEICEEEEEVEEQEKETELPNFSNKKKTSNTRTS